VRLIVHKDACVGHGRCHAEAPELFDLDEMGDWVGTCVLLGTVVNRVR
jgi:ferredoxin